MSRHGARVSLWSAGLYLPVWRYSTNALLTVDAAIILLRGNPIFTAIRAAAKLPRLAHGTEMTIWLGSTPALTICDHIQKYWMTVGRRRAILIELADVSLTFSRSWESDMAACIIARQSSTEPLTSTGLMLCSNEKIFSLLADDSFPFGKTTSTLNGSTPQRASAMATPLSDVTEARTMTSESVLSEKNCWKIRAMKRAPRSLLEPVEPWKSSALKISLLPSLSTGMS